jgi:hypothetical protein
MVQGSCSVPPTRIRDRLFPMVDVGAGRSIGGGSSGKTPEAMSSRILAWSSNFRIKAHLPNTSSEVSYLSPSMSRTREGGVCIA